ncbi:arsenate reductase family protein [Longirhabdus pacifica]|uniref:arsenate reductase family protein n=1 Tax=Longirhabdus pacifica TaxID=2305227 RepID=UPI0010087EC8|nr:arsenate reductase family protein [Longirhabdus pacifica]
MLKVYHYPKCSTCRKAIKWLNERGHELQLVDIVEQPPSEKELEEIIETSELDIQKFFNTSGQVYRQMSLKDKLPSMTKEEKITLLASDGKLIKRPIVVGDKQVTVGFKEITFEQVW